MASLTVCNNYSKCPKYKSCERAKPQVKGNTYSNFWDDYGDKCTHYIEVKMYYMRSNKIRIQELEANLKVGLQRFNDGNLTPEGWRLARMDGHKRIKELKEEIKRGIK